MPRLKIDYNQSGRKAPPTEDEPPAFLVAVVEMLHRVEQRRHILRLVHEHPRASLAWPQTAAEGDEIVRARYCARTFGTDRSIRTACGGRICWIRVDLPVCRAPKTRWTYGAAYFFAQTDSAQRVNMAGRYMAGY